VAIPRSLIANVGLSIALSCVLAGCGGGGNDESPPPPAPPPPGPVVSKAEAFRFLNQASFGATDASAQQVMGQGYEAWIDAQLATPPSLEYTSVRAAYDVLLSMPPVMNIGQLHNNRVAAWFENSVRGQDQLRQRVAFALSEIMVVSQVSLNNYPLGVSDYYDMLARNAFGNFRTLIQDVTLHPMMGVYLSMLGNRKPDVQGNIRPDENYARELMQLFTVGLVQLNLDGSVRRDAQQQPLPTYDQATIEGFAHVFTGWNWAGTRGFGGAVATPENQVQPMQAYSTEHDTGAKQLLAYTGAALTTIPARVPANPAMDLANALDNIVGHPNVAPFIAKQLIQRLVTSNPSPQYIERVATKFNNDGNGVRGNLGAVVKAILLDAEARNATSVASAGKLKEPLLRLTQIWRAYNANSITGALSVPGLSGIFGQGPLQAGSVFNFFSPSYAPPGEISTQNLVAPELQIATEFLNTQVSNYFFSMSLCYVTTPYSACPALPDTTVRLDTSAEMALTNDSTALVDKIADRLLAGQISATLRNEARAQVDRVPTTLPSLRVTEALYLITSSPEFARQQ